MKRPIGSALAILGLCGATACMKPRDSSPANETKTKVSAAKVSEAMNRPEPRPDTPAGPPDFSGAFSHSVSMKEGAVKVDIEIAPGFHAYTLGETIGKPLRLSIDQGAGFETDGDVEYPKGEAKDLPIGKSVIVEGKTFVRAKVKPSGAQHAKEVKGSLQYQVCTNDACDRPRTAEFAVPAS